MRLTRRGLATLATSAVLFGLGQLAGYPLFLAVAATAGGSVAAALAVTTRRPRVIVTRELYPDRVERDRAAFVTLRVRNPGTRRQPGFTAIDHIGAANLKVTVRSLAPGAEPVYRNELPTARRGRHQVGPLVLDRTDALGLSRRRMSIGDTATLWVYPRTHPVRAIAGGRPRHHHEGSGAELRGSLDLREVREYLPGDEVRHLHWKATARTGTLMIRDYADPDQPRFTALLDNRETLAEHVFEEAVELAASLLVAASTVDHRCRLVTPGGLDVTTPGGSPAARTLLDELCVLDRTAATALVPAAFVRSGGGTLVVISAALASADRAALAAIRPRYTDLIVIGIDPDAASDPVPGAKSLHATDAADAARRWQAVAP